MQVIYPNFSRIIGFNCHNAQEPFYSMSSINFIIQDKAYYKEFHIPLGFTSDGCTLKFKLLRLLFGCPHTPKYLPGSIIHDFFCKNRYLINRERATKAFIYVLIEEGVPEEKAKFMAYWMDLFQKYIRKWK